MMPATILNSPRVRQLVLAADPSRSTCGWRPNSSNFTYGSVLHFRQWFNGCTMVLWFPSAAVTSMHEWRLFDHWLLPCHSSTNLAGQDTIPVTSPSCESSMSHADSIEFAVDLRASNGRTTLSVLRSFARSHARIRFTDLRIVSRQDRLSTARPPLI